MRVFTANLTTSS